MFISTQKQNLFAPDFIEKVNKYDRKSLLILAAMYEDGEKVMKDINMAITIYQELIDRYNDKNSMFNLGLIYENGEEIEKDIDKAVELYKKAIKQNDVDSMVNLAILYIYEFSDTKNQEALELLFKASGFKKLIDKNDVNRKIGSRVFCQGKFGHITHHQLNDYNWNSIKVEFDDGTVNKTTCSDKEGWSNIEGWLRFVDLPSRYSVNKLKSSEDVWVQEFIGDQDALFELGKVFQYGKGVPKNIDASIEFYTQASKLDKNFKYKGVKNLLNL